MKTFENQFRVVAEFQPIGDDVVVVRLSPSISFVPADSLPLGALILARLLPETFAARPLYDGSFLIVPRFEDVHVDVHSCADVVNRYLDPFELNVELPDGFVHLVQISLGQSDDARRDYTFRDARIVDLRGVIKVDVDDDETGEC